MQDLYHQHYERPGRNEVFHARFREPLACCFVLRTQGSEDFLWMSGFRVYGLGFKGLGVYGIGFRGSGLVLFAL